MKIKSEQTVMIPLSDRDGREGFVLEGVFRAGAGGDASGAVIAPPHPLMGGSMDNPVVSEIGFACAKSGLASLRFNWRGVGGSAGRPSGAIEDACEDYRAALDDLEQSVEVPLVAAGYSFGAAAAVVASDRPTVRSLVLVSPPPSMLDRERLTSFAGRVFIGCGDSDEYCPAAELEAIVRELPKAELVLLERTDHFFNFGDGLAKLGKALADWLG